MKRIRLSAAGVWLVVVLSGCNTVAPNVPPSVSAAEKQEDVQSSRERDMVILFQSLVQMDKKESLSIPREQAEKLLPLIRRNSSEGEITQADQSEIVALLTPEQKRYVDDFRERLRRRKEEFKKLKDREDLTGEQREAMIREFLSKRKQEHDDDWPPPPRHGTDEDEDRDADEGPSGRSVAPPTTTGGLNVERQLIDLLEGKLH